MPEYSRDICVRKMTTEDLTEVARIEKDIFSSVVTTGLCRLTCTGEYLLSGGMHRGKTGRILWFSAGAG